MRQKRCGCRCPWCNRDIRKHGKLARTKDGTIVKICPCGTVKIGKSWVITNDR